MNVKLLAVFIVIMFSGNLINADNSNSVTDIEEHNNVNVNDVLLTEPSIEKAKNLLSNAPRAFTENRGQLDNDEVRFYDQGGAVWFTDDGVWFELREYEDTRGQGSGFRGQGGVSGLDFDPKGRFEQPEPVEYKRVVLKQEFVGANSVRPVGRERLSWNSNFFYGNDSTKWCTDVPNYGEVFYKNLYDGIDLRYYSNEKGLKYEFVVRPGADYTKIKIKVEGHINLLIDKNGELVIHTAYSDHILRDTNLKVFYADNPEIIIPSNFTLLDENTYTFILESRDFSQTVIIDPLIYSTFIGDTNIDQSGDIDVDNSGIAYVTGPTFSSNFPTTSGANDTTHNGGYDVFVIRLNKTGSSLLYSTFIGGSGYDYGWGIAIDNSGYAYISGKTMSSNFPTTQGANDTINNGEDGFALKLNPTGSTLLYSTFIGGTNVDVCNSIVVDSFGYTYITGNTESSDFPTTIGANDTIHNGGHDVFALKLNPTGSSIVYSTFIGGSSNDRGIDIAVDCNGLAYVTGFTYSTNFTITPSGNDTTYNGLGDAFALKLNNNGSVLIYSTFIGGSGGDQGNSIAVDDLGHAYITGITSFSDFPTTPGANDTTHNGNTDVFALKLDSTGSKLLYSTYIGSSGEDSGDTIVIDDSGYAFITGFTRFSNFPTTPGANDTTYNGGYDVFVTVLNPSGSFLVYSTFIGGSGQEYGYGIAIDGLWNAYITGGTGSSDFPTTPSAYDITHNGGGDVFVSKLTISSNDLPIALDLKIQKPTIYRNLSINIFSNGCDIKDIEKNLTPHFEYRDPNEYVWNDTHFSIPQYQNTKWYVSFTPPKDAILGLYDFRIKFNDTDLLFSNWCYLNNSLTVLNNIPEIQDIILSNNSAILEDIIKIWINTSDIEESEENLSIDLEYQDPNEQSWNTTFLDILQYLDNKWEYSFSIPFNAPFGYYDFRVRCNDSDGNFSSWHYLNDSLLVNNLNPNVINLKLSFNSIYRTNSLSLFINGTDHETPEEMLNLYSQVKPKNNLDWIALNGKYLQNFWQVKIPTDKNSTLGFWDIRVRFEDNESESSKWFYLNDSLEVLNNLPIISDELNDITIGFQPIMLDLSAYESDIEDSNEDLKWKVPQQEYTYVKSISLIDSNNDTLKIIPLEDVTGTEDIELILMDKDNGTTLKTDITIIVDSKITDLTPKVTLISPNDSSIINTLKPTLKWKLNYTGTESITYKIILDENPESLEELKSELTDLEYTLETKLEDGKTYYWTVIPSLNGDSGTCISGIWSFTIDLKMPVPNVNLLSPEDGARTTGPTLTFTWELDYEGTDEVNYQLIIWDLEGTTNIEMNVSITEYILDVSSQLKYFKVYYWKIVPKTESIIGIESDTRTFYYDSKGEIPVFNLELKVTPEVLQLKPGDNATAIARVKHLGELKSEKISLSISPQATSNVNIMIIEPLTREIDKGKFEEFTIVVKVPLGTPKGNVSFKIIARSDTAYEDYDLEYEVNTTLTIQIQEPPEPTTTPDDKTGDTFLIILGLMILAIIIVLVIVFALMKKKKKPPEEKPADTPPIHPQPTPEPPQPMVPIQPPPSTEAGTQPLTQPETLLQPPPEPQLMQPQEVPIESQVQETPQVTQPQPEPQPTVQEPPQPQISQTPQPTVTQQATVQQETPQPTITQTIETTAQSAQPTLQQEQAQIQEPTIQVPETPSQPQQPVPKNPEVQ